MLGSDPIRARLQRLTLPAGLHESPSHVEEAVIR